MAPAAEPPPVRHARVTARVPPGEDLSRIISLSDGVFAFAMTLLVITLMVPSITNPDSSGQLWAAVKGDWKAFYAYLLSFALIANWWLVHHRLFRYVKRYDGTLVALNFAVLLEIALTPFVLSTFAAYPNNAAAVILFSAVEGVTGLTFAGIWAYASREHQLLDPTIDPRVERYYAFRGLLSPIIFGISIVVAFVSAEAAELVWLGVFIVPAILRYRWEAPPDSGAPSGPAPLPPS